MIGQVTAVYCILDDILKALGHAEDPRVTMTDAEVLTTAFTAALFYGGNLEEARKHLLEDGLIPDMLSRSRLCRRLHEVSDLLSALFHQLGWVFKQANGGMEYLVDSFPVPVCDNIRIKRCRLVRDKAFHGYIASKKRYFYGVRVHVMTTAAGIPVEIAFLPGAPHDVHGLEELACDLPPGSTLFADSAYTDYMVEDVLAEREHVELAPMRKKNSLRWDEPPIRDYKQMTRHYVETVFSQIETFLPRHIHAVTMKGFLLKVLLFVFAFLFDKVFLSEIGSSAAS